MTRLFVVLFLFFLCGHLSLSARPVINNVSRNTITDGETLVILGTDFGTKAQAAPLVASYDNGANSFSKMSVGENPGGDWRSTGDNTSPIPISDLQPLRGSGHSTRKKLDCLNSYPPYHGLVYYTPPNTQQMYLSWWHYRDDTEWHIRDGSGNNNKFFRYYWGTGNPVGSPVLSVGDSGSGDGIADYMYFSASDGCRALAYDPNAWSLDYAGGDVGKSSYWYASIVSREFLPHLQQWDHHELYIVFSSSGGALDAKASYWMNGKKVFRASNFSDSDFGQVSDGVRILVLGHVSGAMNSPSHEYLDNIYIDNTWAHVFISDNAELEYPDTPDYHHCEVQVASAWSDNSITITFNQGSFRDGDQVYLFVVDVDGNVSEGYPITIGQSYGQAEDVNQDGSVDINDVQLVVNVILGKAENSRADVNGDGSVTISDTQEVVNSIIG